MPFKSDFFFFFMKIFHYHLLNLNVCLGLLIPMRALPENKKMGESLPENRFLMLPELRNKIQTSVGQLRLIDN
jgi:hypothetical protein